MRRRLPTLAGRLLFWHAIAVIAVLSVLGVVLARALEGYFVDQLTRSLVTNGRAVQQSLRRGGELQREVVSLGRAMGVRITVIGSDGVVLADSRHNPATMENHRSRPEVRRALEGRVGVSSRTSATAGIPFRYAALPAERGRVVRVALPLTTVDSRLATVRLMLLAGFALAALAALLAVTVIARAASRPLRQMASAVERLGQGDLSTEVPDSGTEELRSLAGTVNSMRREVASRMEAVEDARRAREAILSALGEGVMLVDAGGRVLYQNESAARLLGGGIETLRQLAPASLAQLVSSAAAEGVERVQESSVGPDGRRVRAAALPMPDESSILLVLTDVTEARRLDDVRRDFVANASHELKTPVASIQALAETIATAVGEDAAAVPRFAEQLERESVRLSRIISDLLDLSRLEGGTGERSELLLDRLALEEAGRHEERAKSGGLSLRIESDGRLPVIGSARELRLLVRNLVENAIHYTRPGGMVEVRTAREDGDAVLTVTDTGVGIPSREQSRIFERFYRIDPARSRETGGTGLGLSIVRHVAENHAGRVSVESELGQGSKFIVRLPLAPPGTRGIPVTRTRGRVRVREPEASSEEARPRG